MTITPLHHTCGLPIESKDQKVCACQGLAKDDPLAWKIWLVLHEDQFKDPRPIEERAIQIAKLAKAYSRRWGNA